MLTPGCGLFLRIPESPKDRILHPAVAVEANGERVVARLSERVELIVQPGASVFLHGEVNRKFMQQAANVAALLQSLGHIWAAVQREHARRLART